MIWTQSWWLTSLLTWFITLSLLMALLTAWRQSQSLDALRATVMAPQLTQEALRAETYGDFAPYADRPPEQVLAEAREGLQTAADTFAEATTRIVDWTSIAAVSYTHLTLPTIA